MAERTPAAAADRELCLGHRQLDGPRTGSGSILLPASQQLRKDDRGEKRNIDRVGGWSLRLIGWRRGGGGVRAFLEYYLCTQAQRAAAVGSGR